MGKLNRADAAKQAKRLQASPALAPQSDEGRKEIVDCLIRRCDDAEHAERTMTAVLDGCADARNLTAAISSAAAATRIRSVELPPRCATCPPDDWVPMYRGGYSCVGRHDCERGRALLERDAMVLAEQAEKQQRARGGAGMERVAE